MSKSMFRQEVTLTISYDPNEYDEPTLWDWTELTGSYCRVINAQPVQQIFTEDSMA